MRKLTYKEIKLFIEGPEGNECKLLTTEEEYENNKMNTKSKLIVKCKCGNAFNPSFNDFSNKNQRQCKECGRKKTIKACIEANKTQYEIIKAFIEGPEGNRCKLLTIKEEYESNKINTHSKLKIKCKCGNVFKTSFSQFKSKKQQQCKECGKKKMGESHKKENLSEKTIKKMSDAHKGKKHPGWKGGITPISIHLRKCIKPWKIYSMKHSDYKSVISEKPFKHIHHVNKNFSEILELTFKILNIEIKETIEEYTSEELEKLEKICLMLHYFFGPGVCLTEEEHKLFHSLYGKHDNTKEQFEEFKHRFQNGEFIE